jgi:hypothetical protein
MAKKNKIQGTENKAYIEGMRQIRRSNAAGTHDNRPNRQRTRSAARNKAIHEQRDAA